ncbi:MAG: hypothetical protein PHN75_01125 [Syntrophales bacterium]|nr:hypothetical protein [Syntrophales bacterium]
MYDEIIKHINFNMIQLIVDIVLCCAILLAVWLMTRIKPQPLIDKSMLIELQQLISGSHAATNAYLQALNEGRKSAKEVAFLLADREKRAKEVLDKINKTMQETASAAPAVLPSVGAMAAGGMAPEEIARLTGMNEGEIKLMIGLATKKGLS